MTLTEFLLARIAEDEAAANDPEWLALKYGVDTWGREAFSARMLAECQAKRDALSFAGAAQADLERLAPEPARVVVLDRFARLLAQPYADHPDFRPEWRVQASPDSRDI